MISSFGEPDCGLKLFKLFLVLLAPVSEKPLFILFVLFLFVISHLFKIKISKTPSNTNHSFDTNQITTLQNLTKIVIVTKCKDEF